MLRCCVVAVVCTGTDTLGGSLAWLMYELGAHPDIQQKLRDEIIAVMKGVCTCSHFMHVYSNGAVLACINACSE
jgi:cytochrome P450